MPAVSIILPTYNRKRVISRAVQSVLRQTYQDFELIIVDDGSTDGTELLMEALTSEKIKYIRQTINRGVSAARNTGIRLAEGDYVAFQDSDDEWMPDKLEKQLECFAVSPPAVGGVFTGTYVIRDGKTIYEPSASQAMTTYDTIFDLIRKFIPAPAATMLKREALATAGLFDERLAAFEDHELFLRISKYYRFRYVPEPLVVRYNEPGGRPMNIDKGIQSYKLLLEMHFADIQQDKRSLASCYLNLGHKLCFYASHSEGKSYFIKSIRTYPLNIQAYFVLLISVFGKAAYKATVNKYWQLRWIMFRR
jgi:glycosyltransferase involved in cell wall biosynthesis